MTDVMCWQTKLKESALSFSSNLVFHVMCVPVTIIGFHCAVCYGLLLDCRSAGMKKGFESELLREKGALESTRMRLENWYAQRIPNERLTPEDDSTIAADQVLQN